MLAFVTWQLHKGSEQMYQMNIGYKSNKYYYHNH